MKFAEAEVGTVRGPFYSGNSRSRIRYMVKGRGGWLPVTHYEHETESECRKRALAWAAEEKSKATA